MNSAELFRWVLENLDYWVVTIFMAIESSFIPFPSEVIVPPAAWKSMADGSMNIFLVIVFATLGADIGALFNYYLARWLGRPIVYKFADSRIGHMCLIDRESVERAEEFFRKHGAASTFFGRLIPAVRYNIGSRHMELRLGAIRLSHLPIHRPEDNQRRICIGDKIQP